MPRKLLLAGLVACLVAAAAACGGGGDDGGEAASCTPGGTRLTVEAKGLEYDRECLAAPADTAFTVELRNEDSLPHDVAITRDRASGQDVFRGATLTKRGRITYEVPALAAGTYVFYCSIHPEQMNGRFVVA